MLRLGGEIILSSRGLPKVDGIPKQEEFQAILSTFSGKAELTLGHKDMFPDVDLDTTGLLGASLNLTAGPDRKRTIQAHVASQPSAIQAPRKAS
jgi:hypothetical protein